MSSIALTGQFPALSLSASRTARREDLPLPPDGPLRRAADVLVGSAAAGVSSYIIFGGQRDKVLHATVAATVSGVVSQATGKWWAGMGAAIALGVAKELADGTALNPRGSRDLRLNGDLGADLLGAVTGSLLSFRF